MPERTYVYVDGESHFIRSEDAWRRLHGVEATLDRLKYIGQKDDGLILVNAKAKVFWTRRMSPGVDRAYYFTSASVDDPTLYDIKVALRRFELEPAILPERSDLARRRQHELATQGLIEKPKGVDISLAVRMLEDSDTSFDICHLYTSDVDFVPLIEAVRARGKRVIVHGYRHGLSSHSPLHHVCDQFIDLDRMLREKCELD